MQNVISDPVFGLPEKRIQKENAKISPFGMLIWSIPKGLFLKMSFNLSRMKIVRLRLENHSAEKSLEMSVGGGKNGLQA